jgi:mutator protein MutT
MKLVTPVAVCAVMREGRILFIRRGGKTFSGLLSLPGGKIDFGETIEQSAMRELEEETGIRTRFLRHAATIPEHVMEGGNVIKHLMIQLCEMEYLEDTGKSEFEPVWLSMDELEKRRGDITPSDYIMIRNIILPGESGSFFSVIERTESGYAQKEFRKL